MITDFIRIAEADQSDLVYVLVQARRSHNVRRRRRDLAAHLSVGASTMNLRLKVSGEVVGFYATSGQSQPISASKSRADT